MKKTILLLLAVVLLPVIGFAQKMQTEKPDYSQIEKDIADPQSNFYYPKLLQRYKGYDTTMTLQEKRYVYYGFTFQKDYSPYGHSTFFDSLKKVLNKESHSSDELMVIVRFTDSILATNPFDLQAMNYQLYAYDKLQKKSEFTRKLHQMRIIVDAMFSSGDGLTKKTAYYVIYTSHEYSLLNIMGFDFGGQQSLIEHYDFLKVSKNAQEIDGFYFDVSPCLNYLNRTLKK